MSTNHLLVHENVCWPQLLHHDDIASCEILLLLVFFTALYIDIALSLSSSSICCRCNPTTSFPLSFSFSPVFSLAVNSSLLTYGTEFDHTNNTVMSVSGNHNLSAKYNTGNWLVRHHTTWCTTSRPPYMRQFLSLATGQSILKQLVECSSQCFHVQHTQTMMLLCRQQQKLPRVWSA